MPDRWSSEFARVALAALPRVHEVPDLLNHQTLLLCLGLGRLSSVVYEALGGRDHRDAVELAGGLFSLLSKVDDHIVDAPAFHCGPTRESVRRKATAHLRSSLRAIAAPDDERPLATQLGRQLEAMASDDSRREQLWHLLEEGTQLQVDTVLAFPADPRNSSSEEVTRLTRDTPGAWFEALAVIGTLPRDVSRGLRPEERDALRSWAWHLQIADNLVDLAKDVRDGHRSCYLGKCLFESHPTAYLSALERDDVAALYGMVLETDLDRRTLLTSPMRGDLADRLEGLGELHPLLSWIHGFLVARYLAHPLCQRSGEDAGFTRFAGAMPPWYAARLARAVS